MRSLILSAVAALALVGCSSAPQIAVQPPITITPSATPTSAPSAAGIIAQVQAIGTADLNDAETDAVANSDVISTPCYPALVTWLNGVKSTAVKPPPGAGVFYAQQRLRDVAAAQSSVSIPATVKVACAALFVDDATFIAKADAFLAAAVATGGASVPAALGVSPALVGVGAAALQAMPKP